MKFFFDNCISSNLTEAMRLLNPQHSIEHLTKRFQPEALDVEWIPVVAEDRDIIVVSGDPTITTAKKEKAVWKEAGLTGFFFGGGFGDLGKWEQVREVVNWWPEIVRQAKTAQRGSGFLLPLHGFRKPPRPLFTQKG